MLREVATSKSQLSWILLRLLIYDDYLPCSKIADLKVVQSIATRQPKPECLFTTYSELQHTFFAIKFNSQLLVLRLACRLFGKGGIDS